MALAIRDQIDLIIYSQPASDVSIELANFLFGQLYSDPHRDTASALIIVMAKNLKSLHVCKHSVVEHLRDVPKGARTRCGAVIKESLKGVGEEQQSHYTLGTACLAACIIQRATPEWLWLWCTLQKPLLVRA
jgi:hypothetical protein